MPNDSTRPASARDAFGTTQSLANWLELIRKVTVSLAVIVGICVVAIVIVREVFREGIIIDPVIVQLPEGPSAPLSELAAHQIGRQIDVIQRAGVSEWRKLYVDQSTSPIDLQLPGAPFTVKASIREIASVFGVRQPRLRISIVIRRDSTHHYFASVALLGRPEARSSCRADDTPSGLDEILRCVALRAVGHIDPKVAAVYSFRQEEEACEKLDAALEEKDRTIREDRRIKSLRKHCTFSQTQGLIARMLKNGDSDELPWVAYIYGRIHLARAAALAGIDRDQQLAELDQAVDRFRESQSGLPTSPTALTILIESQIHRGVSLQESANSINDIKLQKWRLQLAEWVFEDAEKKLKDLPRSQAQSLRVLVSRFEGKLIYLRWMLKFQQRADATDASMMNSRPDDPDLRAAAKHYAWAAANGPQSAELLTEWGNVLRAIGEFDEAAKKFGRAAEFSPDKPKPWLNIAIARLDHVNDKSNQKPELLQLLIALGASANYLSWSSSEEPSSDFIDRIKRALSRFGTEDAESFSKCVGSRPAAPSASPGFGNAALKACVDEAIYRINDHNIDAVNASANKRADR